MGEAQYATKKPRRGVPQGRGGEGYGTRHKEGEIGEGKGERGKVTYCVSSRLLLEQPCLDFKSTLFSDSFSGLSSSSFTHGRRLFSRGGEECLKNCSTPKNGSRGGDTFHSSRGGVEGGKGGGQTMFLYKKNTNAGKQKRGKHIYLGAKLEPTFY